MAETEKVFQVRFRRNGLPGRCQHRLAKRRYGASRPRFDAASSTAS
jgi:hypothetical protein